MKKILKLMLFVIFVNTNAFSQKECDVLFPSPPIFVNNQKTTFTSYTFKVYYHIIRKNNGKKPSTDYTSIANAHNFLNSSFISSNICFVWSGTDYIDDNDFYNFDFFSVAAADQESSELFQINAHSDGIDVYIIHESTSQYAFNGRVNTIPGNGIIIQNVKFQQSTFPHEMGHIMGLYHAFEESICIENPDGSNSSTCGDLVEDTPAATYSCKYLTTACQYPCSVSYNVSVLENNFMMYAENLNCRTTFTDGQKERMYGVIDQTSDLQQRLVPFDRTIAFQNIPFNIFLGITINDIVQEAKGTLTLQDVNIQSPGKGAFRAEDEIIVLPGFDAIEGCRALLIIENICKAGETQAKAEESVVEYYENEGFRVDISKEEFETSLQSDIQSSLSESIFKIYPNPFTDLFSISIETLNEYENTERVLVEITDLNGKGIILNNYTYLELNRDLEINSSKLQNGFYIIKFTVGEEVFISRIVKQ